MSDLLEQAFAIGMMQLPEEISALTERVRTLRPRNVLEIGSYNGGTFYLWCKLATLGGIKISVDLPNGEFGASDYMDAEQLDARAVRFKSWSPNVHVLLGDSHSRETQTKVRRVLGCELLDFLFIDGDHARGGAEQDWNDYRDLVRPGGLIAFHDVRDSEYHRVNGCLVHEFWKSLPLPKEEIIDPLGYWGGIGLVAA